MKLLANLLVSFFAFSIFFSFFFYFVYPKELYDFCSFLRAENANLKDSEIKIGSNFLHFYEGENLHKKDTIVILHGWGDNRKGFLKLAKYLSQDYYLIIPDLYNYEEYDFNYQVSIVTKLLDTLNIRQCHFVGVSSGGLIPLSLAVKRPKLVKSIILVNTPYLDLRVENEKFIKFFSKKVSNSSDLDMVLASLFYDKPKFSKPIEKMLIKQVDTDLKFVNTHIIPKIKYSEFSNLENTLTSSNVPTLVLHSTYDELIRVKSASMYVKLLPSSTYGTISNTSHFPHYETPIYLASSITNQIESIKFKH